MIEFRCKNCHMLLAKEDIVVGTLEIKCKCGAFNTLTVDKLDKSMDNKFVKANIKS